jgi:hypothetical protein
MLPVSSAIKPRPKPSIKNVITVLEYPVYNYLFGNNNHSSLFWAFWGIKKVLGRDKLLKFSQKHANAKKALDTWFDEAISFEWVGTHSEYDKRSF